MDWSASRGASNPQEQRDLEGLRDVARIAEFHRGIQRAPDDETSAVPTLPAQWDSFVLLECVGRGANGELYRAWDPDLQREVALKLLRADAAQAAGSTEPLLAEGRNLARIRHPGVVTVHGARAHGGRIGLSMEYLRGASLEEAVRGGTAFSAAELAGIGVQLCRALEAVHAAGLLHRDVKPANIVREPEGRIVLTDFGLGEALVPIDGPGPPSGTPLYMPAEVLAGGAPSVASDLYAVGVVLYYLATRRHPFEAPTVVELRELHARGGAPSLAQVRSDLPGSLARSIEHALAPNPLERPASAAALRAELEAAAPEPAAPSEPGVAGTATGPSRTQVLIGALTAVAVLAAVAWFATRPREPMVTAGRDARGAPAATAPTGAYDVSATFLKLTQDHETRLAQGDRVSPGDMLALEFSATRPAYLYVVNEDDHGEAYLLFPQATYDTRNPLAPGETHRLPGPVRGEAQAWGVSSAGGHEHFLVVASPEPLAEVERELAKLPAPTPEGPAAPARLPREALDRLRGTGYLLPAPGGTEAAGRPDVPAVERLRRLVGSERGVQGAWTRLLVLESVPAASRASPP